MDSSSIIAWLRDFFLPIMGMLDVSAGFNARAAALIFLLIMVGEANIAVPLLIESVWLLVGYQTGLDFTAIANTFVLFLIAQSGRQTGMLGVYWLFPAINKPLSRLYLKPLQANRYYRKFASNDYLYNARFLSIPSAALGMMTPLCGPIKIFLILKRRLKVLLVGTLLSGMAFDICYIVLGATFRTTTLNLAYLPAFMLGGFIILLLLKLRARHVFR